MCSWQAIQRDNSMTAKSYSKKSEKLKKIFTIKQIRRNIQFRKLELGMRWMEWDGRKRLKFRKIEL